MPLTNVVPRWRSVRQRRDEEGPVQCRSDSRSSAAVHRPQHGAGPSFSSSRRRCRTPTTSPAPTEWKSPTYGAYRTAGLARAGKGHAAMISRLDSDVGRISLDRLRQDGTRRPDDRVLHLRQRPAPGRGPQADSSIDMGPSTRAQARLVRRGHSSAAHRALARAHARREPRRRMSATSAISLRRPRSSPAFSRRPGSTASVSCRRWGAGRPKPSTIPCIGSFTSEARNRPCASGDWKGRDSADGLPHVELYDLRHDVGETTDVARAHPEIVDQIRAIAREVRIRRRRCGRIGSEPRPRRAALKRSS